MCVKVGSRLIVHSAMCGHEVMNIYDPKLLLSYGQWP